MNLIEHTLEWMGIEGEINKESPASRCLSEALDRTFHKYSNEDVSMAPVIRKHLIRMMIVCPKEAKFPDELPDNEELSAGDLDRLPELWQIAREDVDILLRMINNEAIDENNRD